MELLELVSGSSPRTPIHAAADVLDWIRQTGQALNGAREIKATFIVDLAGELWIADQHSEHAARARGQPVLAPPAATGQLVEAVGWAKRDWLAALPQALPRVAVDRVERD